MPTIKHQSGAPHSVDLHVGMRIRERRKSLKLSQIRMAQALSITFQQVQKYELGRNRISASKLFETATFLSVPVGYFFEGLPSNVDTLTYSSGAPIDAIVAANDAHEIAKLFGELQSANIRARFLSLLIAFVAEQDADGVASEPRSRSKGKASPQR